MILIADDNEADARLIIEALRENGLKDEVVLAVDGQVCLDILHDGSKRPRLLILDLNMPKKNGLEVLAIVKANPNLRLIPVVILTTSDASGDILRSYLGHANSYVTKPLDIDRFISVIGQMHSYWFDVSQLPPESVQV